jgi:hypothetical protein
MKRVPLVFKGLALAAVYGAVLIAECLPTVGGSFNVNGIVVGKNIGPGTPTGCAADAGWGGVAANTFIPVEVNPMMPPMPDTHVSRMFFVAQAAGANIDRMYVGIHVENDDGFTPEDILVLYVDANNTGGAFDAADFAVRIEMGPGTPPNNVEQCNQNASGVTLFRFSGGSWNPQPSAAGVNVKTSFDYNPEMPDPETGLWEVEIEIRPADFATPVTMAVATGARIGAKLYVDEPTIGTRVLEFPLDLNDDDNPNATGPNDGAVTAASLATLTVGSCGFDVKILSIKGADHLGQAGKFTRFPGTVNPAQRNTFNAEVQFFNPANPADTSAVAVANTGTVNMRALPWGNAGPISEIPLSTPMPTATFTALGQVRNVQVNWPLSEADYAPHRANLAAVGHVCYKVHLSGFTTNLNEATDVTQTNLTFTNLSTVRESFLLQGRRQEGPGGVTRYLLRAKWNNLPAKLISERPRRGSWYFQFPTAAKIGLKPVRPGWYAIDLKPGQEVRVDLAITGADYPHTRRDVVVPPRAGGQALPKSSGLPPVVIGVKPGMMVTTVAGGLVTLRPKTTPNGPDGFGLRRTGDDVVAPTNVPYLLDAKGAFSPTENIGALVGSFDKFQTSFVVGSSRTFMVPEKATQLFLAVNDQSGAYNDNGGRGFRVAVILTPPQFLPTRIAAPGNQGNGLPAFADVGANLPQFTVDVLVHDEKRRLIRPAGYVAYAITNAHR